MQQGAAQDAGPGAAPDAARPVAFENTYARLPDRFFARVAPRAVRAPRLIRVNEALARELGIDPAWLAGDEGVAMLAGNAMPAGAEPIALAYAGHQFGYFVPQLGDGRACLLGEVVARSGRRLDLQLKGSGQTPFSRRGDGRAALGPVLREYLVSEAMTALGVPSTRALAAVLTGEQVIRETMLPGAVFARVAASHLRVGTFQYFAAREDMDALRLLAEYATARHYPEAARAAAPVRAFLEAVVLRQAELVARWMALGFIHGVMNTDNMAISGETIDYGPCAFMEAFDPAQVFSSIDQQGRYAYSNQPHAAHWNLTRLAEALLPLLVAEAGTEEAGLDAARAALGRFAARYETARLEAFRAKLGSSTAAEPDEALVEDLLGLMAAGEADFTRTFALLTGVAAGDGAAEQSLRAMFGNGAAFDGWLGRWRERTEAEALQPGEPAERMRRANPVYIPRNHLVEAVIRAAVDRGDFTPFEQLLEVVAQPFRPVVGWERFAEPARPEQCVRQTFCGT